MLHEEFVFWLIRSISLEAIFIVLPVEYFLLTRAVLLALAKSIYENMVNLFSFGCHVIDRAYASTDYRGGVGETIKSKGGVSQAYLGKSTSFILDIHNMVN